MADFVLSNPNLFPQDFIQMFYQQNESSLTDNEKEQFKQLLD